MKARKCIMKAGSLDNYLLRTKPEDIDSKFGLHLRELIRKKRRDPEFVVPYIPGTARLSKTKKTSVWEYHQMSPVYMPAKAKIADDESKYYFKTPQEMSRFEISELEQMLREIDEPDEFVPDEEIFASEEYKELKAQMLQMQPIRHGVIKKWLDKYKYQKAKREVIMKAVEATEHVPREILGADYIHYLDAMPELKQFIAEIEAKEKLTQKPLIEGQEEEEEQEKELKALLEIDSKKLSRKQHKRIAVLERRKKYKVVQLTTTSEDQGEEDEDEDQ